MITDNPCEHHGSISMASHLFGISYPAEEGLKLKGLQEKRPTHSLVVLWCQSWICQSAGTKRHHLLNSMNAMRCAFFLLFFILFLATVALVFSCITATMFRFAAVLTTDHKLNELFKLRAQFPFLTVIQTPVQSTVDRNTHGLNQLHTCRVKRC